MAGFNVVTVMVDKHSLDGVQQLIQTFILVAGLFTLSYQNKSKINLHFLTLMLLVANFANTKWCRKA